MSIYSFCVSSDPPANTPLPPPALIKKEGQTAGTKARADRRVAKRYVSPHHGPRGLQLEPSPQFHPLWREKEQVSRLI